MPSLTRIRRALTLPSRPSSSSTSTTASSSSTDLPSSPTTSTSTSTSTHRSNNSITDLPTIVLTKTTSGLSRIRTNITINKEVKYKRRVEEWERRDRMEWESPSKAAKDRRSRKWSKEHQDLLRTFEFRDQEPRTSFDSGISPCTTRVETAGQQ